MSQSYTCKDTYCNSRYLWDLGQVIEHLRGAHGKSFLRRPCVLGILDSHGHLWYCFGCDTKLGKGYRSFRSDKTMWDHLNTCRDCDVDDIRPSLKEPETVDE
jgi:hypothetical protein